MKFMFTQLNWQRIVAEKASYSVCSLLPSRLHSENYAIEGKDTGHGGRSQ